jgi:hypothetical protein
MPRFLIALSLLAFSSPVFAQTPTAPTSQTAPARSPFRVIDHTEYTPHTELFAEFRPLLLNVPGRFTAHLTNTDGPFKPYTDAEVTLTLTLDGKTAYQETQTKPATPGIYRFPVKSETTGKGRITLTLKTPAYTETFAVENVAVYADEAAALAAGMGRTNEPAEPGMVTYYKEKSWLETFATAPVMVAKKAIVVPQTAILSENGASFVYVQTDPEHFRKQAVTLGKAKGDSVAVETGLKAGDRVVTQGADKLK